VPAFTQAYRINAIIDTGAVIKAAIGTGGGSSRPDRCTTQSENPEIQGCRAESPPERGNEREYGYTRTEGETPN
jgi:hypothetical protein